MRRRIFQQLPLPDEKEQRNHDVNYEMNHLGCVSLVWGDAMSRLQARLKSGILAAAANAACFLAGAAWAQPPTDPGNTTRRPGEAASKQAEADIRLAVRDAQRLTATDPAKAVERLQDALAQVDSTAGSLKRFTEST